MSTETILSPFYYLDNFKKLTGHVANLYSDLLPKETQHFLTLLSTLTRDEQALYVRLCMRTKPILLKEKINYTEINNLNKIFLNLQKYEFVKLTPNIPLQEYLPLLTIAQLKKCYQELGIIIPSGKRNKLLLTEGLIEHQHSEIKEYLAVKFPLIETLFLDQVDLLKLLFFGNSYQDFSEFIISQLDIVKYEQYSIKKAFRYFKGKEDIEQKLFLINFLPSISASLEEENVALFQRQVTALLEFHPLPKFKRSYDKLLNEIGSIYEKSNLLEEAIIFYKNSSTPPARERLVRILSKYSSNQAALDIYQKWNHLQLSEVENETLYWLKQRIKKEEGLAFEKKTNKFYLSAKLELTQNKSLTIEEQVVNHLNNIGTTAFYTENHFWSILFGLLFWDEIFLELNNVFYHPFQRGPIDMFHENFYQDRKHQIDQKLNLLKETDKEQIWEILSLTYQQKHGIANWFVNWKKYDINELKKVYDIIPKNIIVFVLTKISKHPSEFKSGLPDLCIFEEEKQNFYFCEIKGPGDQLRSNQITWLRSFNQANIPAYVYKITWIDTDL